jgi:hypothetical protein
LIEKRLRPRRRADGRAADRALDDALDVGDAQAVARELVGLGMMSR